MPGTKECDDIYDPDIKKMKCDIEIGQDNLKKLAGKYEIEVIATDSDDNEAKASEIFQIGCVSNDYSSKGLCLNNCGGREIIQEDKLALICKEQGFMCCKV